MSGEVLHKTITYFISVVWLVNGLFCKILNLVPRHEQIVAQILGRDYSRPLVVLIGVSEFIMSIWILSGYKTRLNAITQIMIVLAMNIIEFILVPNLLLWGKMNIIFSLLFIGLVYYNEYVLRKFAYQ